LQKAEEARNTTFDTLRSTGNVLEKLNLIKDGNLTNAAILLFGKNSQKHFIQSEIRCARFNGTEPVDFADIQVIKKRVTVLDILTIQHVPIRQSHSNKN
jgi:ATP-dependent DNA helicase RecG